MATPQIGASNAGGLAILSQYLASVRAVNHSSSKCNTLSCDGLWRVYNTGRW